jgi:hypothetical protein
MLEQLRWQGPVSTGRDCRHVEAAITRCESHAEDLALWNKVPAGIDFRGSFFWVPHMR